MTTRSLVGVLALGFVTLTLGTGCAATTTAGGAGQQASAAGPARWESRVLADGVELRVSDDAGPEARRIAEDFQSEMRSRYLNARQ